MEDTMPRLEGQIDKVMDLYDLAENAYSYENLRGDRALNEDDRRRQVVGRHTYGSNAQRMMANTLPYSLFAVYLFSRRGAAHMLDFSRVSQCYWRTFGWYMIGQTFAMSFNLASLHNENNSQNTLKTRVEENEVAHSVLRAMKFHLTTRQMSVWDQDPR